MLRRDYLLAAIDELGRALARIAGLRHKAEHEEALAAVEGAKRQIPAVPGVLDQLSTQSLLRLLTEPTLREQLAELYQQEAELCYVLGQRERAVRCAERAERLRQALSAPPKQ